MNLLKPIMLVFTTILISCGTTDKKMADDKAAEKTEDTKMEMNKMLEEGWMRGEIVASKAEGDCPYTIKMEGEDAYFLDPINLEEIYKNNGEKIWFKFAGLRMMNRCEKANPVNITEIKKREE